MINDIATNQTERELIGITLEYDNGDKEVLAEGMVVEFKHHQDEDTATISMQMVGMSGHDVAIILESIVESVWY